MRTGTAQASPTAHPKVTVVVGGDTHISEGGSGNDRVVSATTDEQAWGGRYTIELDNADETLNAKDYKGEPLDLKFHFVGQTADSLPPLWVDSQEFISKEGKLLLVLNCVDIWAFIEAHNVTLVSASYNQTWQTAAGLADRMMPDESLITHAKWSTIYNALVANSDMTIWEILQDLDSQIGITLSLDDDDGLIDTLKPPISFSNARSGIKQLMDMTKSYLRWTAGSVLRVFEPGNHATAYSFSTDNLFFSNAEKAGVTIPNRIYFWAYNEAGDEWISSDGTALDSDSYDKIGQYIDRHYLIATFDTHNKRSEAELNAYAAAALEKIQAERSQGMLVAPMHCTVELFDKISVVDSRYTTPKTTTGYIHRIQKEYSRGVYTITIQLGGVTSGYTVPGGAEAKGLAGADPPKTPLNEAILSTQIEDGYIKLTASTVKDGEWYDLSGVEIDATHGINIYGTANALTTRETKDGTIQCYVGADGKIYAGAGAVSLDVDGIHIYGEILDFYSGVTKGGQMGYDGNYLYVTSVAGKAIGLVGGATKPLILYEGTLYPFTTGLGALGLNSKRFLLSYIVTSYVLNTYPIDGNGTGVFGTSGSRFLSGYINKVYANTRLVIPVGTDMYD